MSAQCKQKQKIGERELGTVKSEAKHMPCRLSSTHNDIVNLVQSNCPQKLSDIDIINAEAFLQRRVSDLKVAMGQVWEATRSSIGRALTGWGTTSDETKQAIKQGRTNTHTPTPTGLQSAHQQTRVDRSRRIANGPQTCPRPKE